MSMENRLNSSNDLTKLYLDTYSNINYNTIIINITI